ncbi:hypothetical protein GCK72_013173 [Caenorhabditis remanei]|uniref:Uncharacterized protein n=1 Tax=Caenorhabditis remanei TaxID=31234 RepID=A0A6A5GQH4_CAERE|nr:hypothetical protein GCK72_013173 [Caenorhabditis remanei]KAF1756719.1 hypothetical protein GCK72_013173 [Caenorhabditis remanei]
MNPCVVCLVRRSGRHFGIDACRGCTAFFRRSVVSKNQYKCSENDTCDIDKSKGLQCKKCRFERCLKMGMRRDYIQSQRDFYDRQSLANNPVLSISNFQNNVGILSTIEKDYSHLENIREVVHRMEGVNMFMKPSPRGQTYKETYRLLLREFYLVADWISSSFPIFTAFPTSQKGILLRNFYLTFYNLEAGFFACQRNRNDVWFLPNGNFINCQNLESFYHDPNNLQPMTSADAARLFEGTRTQCKRNVLEPMLRENVTQFEFLALVALILFDTGLEGQTDSCLEICRKVRTTVQREMIHYYSTKRVEEYPLRMANILSIIPSVQKASQKMQSDMELGHLFNAYSAEKPFFENCMGKR